MGVLKNDVGRPSNKTIMIRTILKGICLIILLGVVAAGAYYLGNNNHPKKTTGDKTTTASKEVGTDLDINSGEAVKLFNKFQTNMSLNIMEKKTAIDYFGYFYSKDKITKEDVPDVVKFGLAIKNLFVDEMTWALDENEVKNSNKSVVDVMIKEMFNSEINYDVLDEAEFFGQEFTLNKDGSFKIEAAGVGSGDGSNTYTKITSAKKYSDRIEITNKVIFVWGAGDQAFAYKTFKLSGKGQLQDQIADLSVGSKEYVDTFDERLVDKYEDKLDSYKWTFVKQGGHYVFDSVEKVK